MRHGTLNDHITTRFQHDLTSPPQNLITRLSNPAIILPKDLCSKTPREFNRMQNIYNRLAFREMYPATTI